MLAVRRMSERFCERGKVMSRSGSGLTSTYNHFLFAPICEEANGMQLSVLSALVRMDVDPWEEATRLAAMPEAIAERALVSTLDRALGRSRTPSETEVIAARLVQLLPRRGEGVTIAPTATAGIGTQQTYWLVYGTSNRASRHSLIAIMVNPTNPQTEASAKEIQSMPPTPDGCQSPGDPRLKQLQP